MSEGSKNRDSREIAREMAEELSRGDLDAYMSHFVQDAVWQSRFGIRLEGATAIRSYTAEFVGSVEGYRAELLEVRDLGGGVTFSVARHGGRPSGSGSELLEDHASVSILVDGLVESMATYSDIDEALAAAERLAEERGQAMSENVELVRSIVADWERGDFMSVEWADPGIEFIFADGPAPARWKGLDGMAEGWREFLSTWEGFHAEAEEFREIDRERVLVLLHNVGRGKMSGLHLGEMQAEGAALFHLRAGKVTRFLSYFDGNRARADLGLEE